MKENYQFQHQHTKNLRPSNNIITLSFLEKNYLMSTS